jgi:hypothetical protein
VSTFISISALLKRQTRPGPGDIDDTVFEDVWNGWDPIVQHRELEGGIWCGRRAP